MENPHIPNPSGFNGESSQGRAAPTLQDSVDPGTFCKPGIELREIVVNMRNMLEIWRNMLEYVGKSWKFGGKRLEIGGKVVASGSNICIFCQLPVNQRTET